MATPSYNGKGQPGGSCGGWLSTLLGTPMPAYAGDGQRSSSTSGFLGGSMPAYRPAPAASPNPAPSCDPSVPETFAIVIPRS
jgi:hypothetical protein